MNSTNATCTERALYARVKRWRDRICAPLNGSEIQLATGGTPSSISSGSNSKSATTRTSERQKKRMRQEEVLKSFMPTWLDADKTLATLSKRSRRSSTNHAQDNFSDKIERTYRQQRFKVAFKEVQRILKNNRMSDTGTLQPKKGRGIRAVIDSVKKELLDSPNDMKLTKGAIESALLRGDEVSPLKKGRKVRIPHELTYALATHSTMMQVAGDGEASAANMKSVVSAVLAGTEHEGKMDIDYIWRKTREKHPEIINPVRAKNHENRRVDWLSYKNLIQWNKRAKEFLINMGMAKDESGLIREYDFSFIPFDCRVITDHFNSLLR